MEACSSNGSSQFFTSNMPNELELPYQFDLFEWFEAPLNDEVIKSLTDQDQLNQVETSDGSCQTKSRGRRSTLTQAQRKENKRKSDEKYRKKCKIAVDEQTAENKHLKERNERLSAENGKLKELMRLLLPNGQLPAEASQRLDSYLTQANGKQLEHQSTCGQATREKISEKINVFRDLVPGCNKVKGVPLLDETINYIQSLQRQVEFLSMKLATVNSSTYPTVEPLPHKEDHHGTNSGAIEMLQNLQEMTAVNVVPTNDYVTGNQKNAETGICGEDETPVTKLLMKIDADDESKVQLSDFNALDGERIEVGKYSFPLALHPTVESIIDVCGDISAKSKMNINTAETIYIMFCAAVKEMSDLHLQQVTEDRILKWRDAIKDASRISFEVDFAMEHLKKIACGYIGLKERRKLENVACRITKLEAELSAGKQEHAKIRERSKVYMDVADEFSGTPVSSGMFQSLATTN